MSQAQGERENVRGNVAGCRKSPTPPRAMMLRPQESEDSKATLLSPRTIRATRKRKQPQLSPVRLGDLVTLRVQIAT